MGLTGMTLRETIASDSPRSGGIGFLGYLMIVLWFLLTVMASAGARAETAPQALTASDILPDIETALIAEGAPAGAEITLADPARAIAVSAPVRITHVSYSAASGRFVVRLEGAPAAIAGALRVAETAPVLTRAIERGEIIGENDIAFVEIDALRGDRFVRHADELIGKAARRRLPAESPVRLSDVAAPVLVRKGALVTLVFAIDGLRLTHRGVAMDSGAAGEVVSVKNIQSDRVLKGVVEAENYVAVAAPHEAL